MNNESLAYMGHYGEILAGFHQLHVDCEPVKHRRFFDMPEHTYFVKHGLERVEEFLNEYPPIGQSKCFIHGDFHYANILW